MANAREDDLLISACRPRLRKKRRATQSKIAPKIMTAPMDPQFQSGPFYAQQTLRIPDTGEPYTLARHRARHTIQIGRAHV